MHNFVSRCFVSFWGNYYFPGPITAGVGKISVWVGKSLVNKFIEPQMKNLTTVLLSSNDFHSLLLLIWFLFLLPNYYSRIDISVQPFSHQTPWKLKCLHWQGKAILMQHTLFFGFCNMILILSLQILMGILIMLFSPTAGCWYIVEMKKVQ